MAEAERRSDVATTSRAVVVWQAPQLGDEDFEEMRDAMNVSEGSQEEVLSVEQISDDQEVLSNTATTSRNVQESNVDLIDGFMHTPSAEVESSEHLDLQSSHRSDEFMKRVSSEIQPSPFRSKPTGVLANVEHKNETTFITIAVPQAIDLNSVFTAAEVFQLASLGGRAQGFYNSQVVVEIPDLAKPVTEYAGSPSSPCLQKNRSPLTQIIEETEETQVVVAPVQFTENIGSDTNPDDLLGVYRQVEKQKALDNNYTIAPATLSEDPLLQLVPDDEGLGTDYLLSTAFLHCEWAYEQSNGHKRDSLQPHALISEKLKKLACPALWELARKRLLLIRDIPMQQALEAADLSKVRATILQLMLKLQNVGRDTSCTAQDSVIELCTSFREAIWVHTLRLILQCSQSKYSAISSLISRILSSAKYKAALGRHNSKHLRALRDIIAVKPASNDKIEHDNASVLIDRSVQDTNDFASTVDGLPTRLLCSMEMLSQDELLDELHSVHQISFIERQLSLPVDVVVDEKSAICLLDENIVKEERSIKTFVIQLAQQQAQYERIWIIVSTSCKEEVSSNLLMLYSALVNFRIDTTVLISESIADTCEFIRTIVDVSAAVAGHVYGILPKLWYERPYLIEDESQHERFLASTGVVNCFSAQSLLHKLPLCDLLSQSLEELQGLAEGAISADQLTLLWSMLHSNHGIGFESFPELVVLEEGANSIQLLPL